MYCDMKKNKEIIKIILLLLIVSLAFGCKNSSTIASSNTSESAISSSNTSLISSFTASLVSSSSIIKITNDNAGSILKIKFDDYIEYDKYIHLNGKVYLSDYCYCLENQLEIGNMLLTYNNKKYEIKDIYVNSDHVTVIDLRNPNLDYYTWYSYYDDNLKRINIMPIIDNDNYVDCEIDIFKDAYIKNDIIEPFYISDIINNKKLFDDLWCFVIESDSFDENNIIAKLTEYVINDGD